MKYLVKLAALSFSLIFISVVSCLAAGENTTGGVAAGANLSTGTSNTIIGAAAGAATSTNTDNTSIGYKSGTGVTGNSNIIVGEDPSSAITSGSSNILVGNSLTKVTNTSSNQIDIGDVITAAGTNTPSTSTTTIQGNLQVDGACSGCGPIVAPQGRLSLSSTAPVMTADATAQTTIYYLPYTGSYVPIYNGSNFVEESIGSSLSLTLSSTFHPSTEVFDVYAFENSGTPTLCALYWGGNTSRSSTTGGYSGSQNATITQQSGFWVNNAAIASGNCYNGSTSYAISQYQGTLLGSFYTTGAGQTGVQFTPASASGGANNIIGLSNAYNLVAAQSQNIENRASWTYATATWEPLNNSTSDRITYLDSLQQIQITASTTLLASNSTAGNQCDLGMNEDSTTATPILHSNQTSSTNTLGDNTQQITVLEHWAASLGLHYIQSMQVPSGSFTCTYLSGATGILAAFILKFPY